MNNKNMLLLGIVFSGPILGSTCDELRSLALTNVTLTAAQLLPAGDYQPQVPGATLTLPAHCRIAAVLAPSSDSHIEMELWLPDSNWNGKFLALGNGGWAGSISYSAMASGLKAGYAVASNDTGHKGGSAAFMVGHPEKLVDFGYRSMHEMAVQSKLIIERFYERQPALSYYEGCSTGGRQGLMEAQRYPEDFDAIIAGAPVNNQFNLNLAQLLGMVSVLKDRSLYLPPDKIQLLHAAVLAQCEANDGVKDGFLNNPLACDFDPTVLQCKDGAATGATTACLTARQVESVRRVYAPVVLSSGTELYPGHALGFELGWRMLDQGDLPSPLQSDVVSYIAHENPAWDWQSFDLESDARLVLARAHDVTSDDPDLSAFKARGGKLLMYHGWNDPGPAPANSIAYYGRVLQTLGSDQSDWLRLFMMPGMGHCRGDIGPDQADFLTALDQWREQGVAPATITATRVRDGRVDMSRPLCPHPQVATWMGTGNPDDADFYECTAQ